MARHPAGDLSKRTRPLPVFQQHRRPHRNPIRGVRKQARHGRGQHRGRTGAAAHSPIPPTADTPPVRRDLDLDQLGLHPAVAGQRPSATLAARVPRRQFHDLGTYRQRLARRARRPRPARLLAPTARRRRPRLPLAAIAEPVPGIVRTHRLQPAQPTLQLHDPALQPTLHRRPRQCPPQHLIVFAQRRHLAPQLAILPAQRHHRRPTTTIHRLLFQQPPQARRLGHRRQRTLRPTTYRTAPRTRLFQLLLVLAMDDRQRPCPTTRLDRFTTPIRRLPMTPHDSRVR